MDQKPDVHLIFGSKCLSRRYAGAFTLIELLVVISIIVLIIGIGAVTANQFLQEARKEQVRAMLEGLVGGNDTYKATLNQGNINHNGRYPINWQSNGGDARSSSERFVFACKQVKSAEQAMLNALSSGGQSNFKRAYRDTDGDGVEEVYDRWGTEIEFRTANAGTRATGDGPPRVGNPTRVANDLLPDNPAPFFVSAGPDKQFGTEDDISSLDR